MSTIWKTYTMSKHKSYVEVYNQKDLLTTAISFCFDWLFFNINSVHNYSWIIPVDFVTENINFEQNLVSQ